MSEKDLGLKVAARRLFWSMGYSTRIDVDLRAFTPIADQSTRRGSPQAITNLDVLGVGLTGSCRILTEIADCKSSLREASTSRMFWLRGVADFFGADHAYLVQEGDVSEATRELSAKLGVTVKGATSGFGL